MFPIGADLFFTKVYDKNKKKYEPLFNKWVTIRDTATDTKERELAQEKVDEYYEKMQQHGYFRDSYNDSSLLRQFNLSWWTDVIPMLNKKGQLDAVRIPILLNMLKLNEPIFEMKIKRANKAEREYFVEKYKTFRDFLQEALRLKGVIDCSL